MRERKRGGEGDIEREGEKAGWEREREIERGRAREREGGRERERGREKERDERDRERGRHVISLHQGYCIKPGAPTVSVLLKLSRTVIDGPLWLGSVLK